MLNVESGENDRMAAQIIESAWKAEEPVTALTCRYQPYRPCSRR